MKSKLLVLFLILGICFGVILPTGVSAEPTPTWVQVNEDGFGDWLNLQIPSLAVFGAYLYAGVWHFDIDLWAPTAQIWRSPDGSNWEKVFEAQANAAANLIAYKDHIYAASWGPNGRLWRSADGVNWEDVTDGLEAINLDIARLTVFKNSLYASSYIAEGTGAEVWVTVNGTTWVPYIQQGMGDPNNYGAISDTIFKGRLYWGVSNAVSGAQLWRTDGATTEAVITDGFGLNIGSLSSLATFGNYLYAGGWWGDTIQVWRSANGSDWEQVHARQLNGVATALEVFGDELFLVVENIDTGLEVWNTTNGIDWMQVGFDGFGDPHNEWSYWDNATVVFRGDLYIATVNWWTAGEVWKYCRTGCQ